MLLAKHGLWNVYVVATSMSRWHDIISLLSLPVKSSICETVESLLKLFITVQTLAWRQSATTHHLQGQFGCIVLSGFIKMFDVCLPVAIASGLLSTVLLERRQEF
jgi:putative exporter of polyketide antibiotics